MNGKAWGLSEAGKCGVGSNVMRGRQWKQAEGNRQLNSAPGAHFMVN